MLSNLSNIKLYSRLASSFTSSIGDILSCMSNGTWNVKAHSLVCPKPIAEKHIKQKKKAKQENNGKKLY